MFDPKCYELAEHFLPADASEERKRELAQDIQDYIELMLFEPEHAVEVFPAHKASAPRISSTPNASRLAERGKPGGGLGTERKEQ